MCFSATASLAAASALTVCGAYTFIKASKPFKLLGAIPLLFAIQQLSEGVLWYALEHNTALQSAAMYFFLFFASFIWPLWIPLAMRIAEPDTRQRTMLSCLCILGGLLGIAQLIVLFWYGAQASIAHHHIVYTFFLPPSIQSLQWPATIAYWCAIIIPGFISSITLMNYFAALVAIAYAIAYLLYYQALASVWCFFAALISGLLVIIIRKQKI